METGVERAQWESLGRLTVDPELERLESIVDNFNILDAIGVSRQELRHSALLAFLLDPMQPHGLGSLFLKRFLKHSLLEYQGNHDDLIPSPVQIDIRSFESCKIFREWCNTKTNNYTYDFTAQQDRVDILIHDRRVDDTLTVIIENKIDSDEHHAQLQRYWNAVKQRFKTDLLFGIFLVPERNLTEKAKKMIQSLSDEHGIIYIIITYELVIRIIEELLECRPATMGTDLKVLLKHYCAMLRRQGIVNNPEIEDLCKKLYNAHKKAFDLVFEYRDDLQTQLSNEIERLRRDAGCFTNLHSQLTYPSFIHQDWEQIALKQGTEKNREYMLRFEVANLVDDSKARTKGSVRISLAIYAGPEEIRIKLFKMAKNHQPPFKIGNRTLGKNYTNIWSMSLVNWDKQHDDFEKVADELKQQWRQFLTSDLPSILSAVREESWIFTSNADNDLDQVISGATI